MADGTWKVVCEPKGDNPSALRRAGQAIKSAVTKTPNPEDEDNTGGMIIYVERGGQKEEVSRVAWVRRVSMNPKTSFEKQLGIEVAKAEAAVKTLNNMTLGAGELQ